MSSWVCLKTTRGPLVTRAEAVAMVTVCDYAPIPFEEVGVEVVLLTGAHYSVAPEPGESKTDALARVCGLLGIEVTR